MSRQLLTEAREILAELVEDESPGIFEALDLETKTETLLGGRIVALIDKIDAELGKGLVARILSN